MKALICSLSLAFAAGPVFAEPSSMSQNPRTGLLAEIKFTQGSTRLPDAAGSQLGRIAGWAEENFDSLIVLDGYADRSSAARAGLLQSLRRARLVRDQLVALGVDPDQIVITGLGADHGRHAQVRVWGTRNSLDQVMATRRGVRGVLVVPPYVNSTRSGPTLAGRRAPAYPR
jgi:hypothetical protein